MVSLNKGERIFLYKIALPWFTKSFTFSFTFRQLLVLLIVILIVITIINTNNEIH